MTAMDRWVAAACAELWNQVPTEVIRLTIWPDGTVERDNADGVAAFAANVAHLTPGSAR